MNDTDKNGDRSSRAGGYSAARATLHAFRHRWMIDWASPWEYTAHAIRREIYHARSEFQEIEIVETEGYGRCLLLDGEVQSFESDEYIYHECLVLPALLLHPGPQNVLVIGGGEGATLREVLRHRSVARAVMVDLDKKLIDATREHLPTFHQGSFDDRRAQVVFGDGRAFIERSTERFDVIVIDVTNPLAGGPSFKLFTLEFYHAVKDRLNPQGIVVLQSDAVSLGGLDGAATIYQTVSAVWSHVYGSAIFLPAYTTDWSFTIGSSDSASPASRSAAWVDAQIERNLLTRPRFYDGIVHQRLFHLPRYVRDAFALPRAISRDDRPIQESFPGLAQ